MKKFALIAILLSQLTDAGVIPRHRKPKDSDVLKVFRTGNIASSMGTHTQENTEIKLLVWNMFKGKNDSWEKDFKNLSSQSDLIVAQEFYLDYKMKNVFDNFGNFEYVTATSFFYDGKIRTGVTTIARTLASNKKFLFAKKREPVVKSPKVALITDYPLKNGQILKVANIHGVNFVSASALQDQLYQIVSHLKFHHGPIIFAGDFNTWTKKKIKMMKQTMRLSALEEVKFSGKDSRMTFNGKILDYIFFRNLKLKEAKVLGHIKGADHKPMIVKFELF